MKNPHTTIAGICILLSWLTAVLLVYQGKVTFDIAMQGLISIFTLAATWGFFKAKDNSNTPPTA
jgi:uncharacterized protein with PQ loop repeat